MGKLGTGGELPVAPWHRGFSLAQIKAACELQTELSHDLEEETTHRVYDCLRRLGVSGQLDCCLLDKIMQLSQGNNLAFLYFLYTLLYASQCPHRKYTLNEQVILSAIAYLDMPATIEALDKILPMPEKRLSTRPSKPFPSARRAKADTKQDSKVLPYFQKQRRPQQKSRDLLSAPLPYAVRLPNECKDSQQPENRWFADFEFHPVKRIVKSVISQEIVKLFDGIDECGRSAEAAPPASMCEYHQESRTLERAAYLEKQRQQCLAMLDLDEERKLLTRQRIAKQLQLDVHKYMQKFGNNRWSPGVPAFRQIGCTACQLLGPTPLPVMVLDGNRQWQTQLNDSIEPQEQVLRLSGGQDAKRPTPSINYFQGPKLHAPYIFDYIGLFGRYSQMSLAAGECIDGAVLRALEEDNVNEKERPIMVTRWHINDAVNQCVRRIYEKSLMAVKYCDEPKERLSYGEQQHFDPDDEVFMDRMLADAFRILQKNKKLVLATLYNGHQVPELREWIRRRYGKRYTVATRSELRDSGHTMQQLSEMHHELYTILMGQRSESKQQRRSISHTEYDLFLARAQKFRLSFKEHVNEIVMERTRLCWREMHYLRTRNYTNLQQTFFSYLPGCACETAPIFANAKKVNGKCHGKSLGK
ncbi:uncharacterized protein LOC111064678 [Drosophila obscura]|uniref:uncharacterized protein LOC111064678 n=1 Tax=Drosophila obscura TaxID=7282 RepID=UPI001BB10A1F|nr:uncharacterized protein LOC111064678 [Drosophila obscura]